MADERSPEQKAKDLRDALLAVDNKTIDGIPWYQAEALASALSQAKADLAKATNRLSLIEQADGKAHEVVKDLLGMNPDAGERMWYETAQRLMGENTDLKASAERAEADRVRLENVNAEIVNRLTDQREANHANIQLLLKSETLAKEQERVIAEKWSREAAFHEAFEKERKDYHAGCLEGAAGHKCDLCRAYEFAFQTPKPKALTPEPAKEAT